jgi:hypothetical protein
MGAVASFDEASSNQGRILDDANASLTTAESFNHPQANGLSSQRVVFDPPVGRFTAGDDGFLGINIRGGPAG